MRGATKLFSITTLRPLGPSVTFTALARISTPRSKQSRASPENLTSFAALCGLLRWLVWHPSLPRSSLGLSRQSIIFERFVRRWMDARVEPAHDDRERGALF